jgi:Na+/glutamate symporter
MLLIEDAIKRIKNLEWGIAKGQEQVGKLIMEKQNYNNDNDNKSITQQLLFEFLSLFCITFTVGTLLKQLI